MTTPFLTEFDIHLLAEGTHYRTYEKLGAHPRELDGVAGTHFAVWAPNAAEVSVVGDFNEWQWHANPMKQAGAGIWETFIPGVKQGVVYKYGIRSKIDNYSVEKADPYGFASEIRPATASKVWDLSTYQWNDAEWLKQRPQVNALEAPLNIYELHLGSWMRNPDADGAWLTYRDITTKLVAYVKELGYTHVELLPIAEHPFDGSWGYQVVGYFSPTSRFGTPEDFMHMVDSLHQAGIGVILDWVPAHFPTDGHGLGYFDGTHLYEHADPRQGKHAQWDTLIFNYGRTEVRNFLISNALFWLDKYHIDGLRVDAVASMLYLDYGREGGDWVPNQYGGRENLEAVEFIKHANDQIHQNFPDVLTIAEESTAFPKVTYPVAEGGLGFDLKWNMGWMHDILKYMSFDPVYRRFHHNHLTFGIMYHLSEKFVLPFSHDEVVHLKKSMLDKMPGDTWQKFANLRLLYGFMAGYPGKKLTFMGGEFGQWKEWNHDFSLDWHLLDTGLHRPLQHWVRDLSHFYRSEPAMFQGDFKEDGFRWIDCSDVEQSVVSFMRRGDDPHSAVVIVCNFTPIPRHDYRVGVPWGGHWEEKLNSNAEAYGGTGLGNMGGVEGEDLPMHQQPKSIGLTLPPLSVV
ncbi:MAG: 1,4-alpha-glucan branching protein GlgB, partial [Candidatus Sericytochromatia bacterium]